jgi:hypothetical protein
MGLRACKKFDIDETPLMKVSFPAIVPREAGTMKKIPCVQNKKAFV